MNINKTAFFAILAFLSPLAWANDDPPICDHGVPEVCEESMTTFEINQNVDFKARKRYLAQQLSVAKQGEKVSSGIEQDQYRLLGLCVALGLQSMFEQKPRPSQVSTAWLCVAFIAQPFCSVCVS